MAVDHPITVPGARALLPGAAASVCGRGRSMAVTVLADLDFRVLEALNDGAWVSDAGHRIVFVNSAMVRICGLEAGEILGLNVLELPDETIRFFRDHYLTACRTLCPREYEALVVTPVGRPSWQAGWLTPFTVQGAFGGMLCVVREVGERTAVQEALFGGDLVGILKVRGEVILWANQALADMLGYSAEALTGLPARRLHPSVDDDARFRREAAPVLGAGQVYRTDFRALREDGSEAWFAASFRQLPNDGDAWIGVFVDITERKRYQAGSEEARQRLELALAGSDLGMWDWDIPSGRVSFNSRWGEMLGYAPDELASSLETWKRLVCPEDWPSINEALQAHLRGERAIYESEHRLWHKDGHWVWVLDRGKVVARDAGGQPLRAAGTHLDISDRKRLKLEGTELLRRIESLILGLDARPQSAAAEPADASDPALPLSTRQRQVLALIAGGRTSGQIAEQLNISPATAATHRRDLMRKLGLHSTADLTRYALRHKLLSG